MIIVAGVVLLVLLAAAIGGTLFATGFFDSKDKKAAEAALADMEGKGGKDGHGAKDGHGGKDDGHGKPAAPGASAPQPACRHRSIRTATHRRWPTAAWCRRWSTASASG